jgi:hypothetical protein
MQGMFIIAEKMKHIFFGGRSQHHLFFSDFPSSIWGAFLFVSNYEKKKKLLML